MSCELKTLPDIGRLNLNNLCNHLDTTVRMGKLQLYLVKKKFIKGILTVTAINFIPYTLT